MSSTHAQQPIFRTIGKRQTRDGLTPDALSITAQTSMANYFTRVPKGLFLYDSHAEMDADRLRWTVDLIQSKSQ